MPRWLKYLILLSGVCLFTLPGCEKNNDTPDPVTDIDGNIYETIRIGNQVWMTENLRTTRLNDGSEIKLITKNQEWYNNSDPAFSWYNNDSSMFKVPYGALYNGYVAVNERICPAGWRVPYKDDWKQLVQSFGDTIDAGGRLKVEGLTQWHFPNTGADNSSDFSALPAGMRYFEGTYSSLSYFTAFWSTTQSDTTSLSFMSLSYLDAKATFGIKSKRHGFSIRCIRDN
jgi:uncharacterized protein (TIGR02145 family)